MLALHIGLCIVIRNVLVVEGRMEMIVLHLYVRMMMILV